MSYPTQNNFHTEPLSNVELPSRKPWIQPMFGSHQDARFAQVADCTGDQLNIERSEEGVSSFWIVLILGTQNYHLFQALDIVECFRQMLAYLDDC